MTSFMAHQRGNNALKSILVRDNFQPRFEVDTRSNEAKIVVTNKETNHSTERKIAMNIIMFSPQPTITHSFTVAYDQCVRELSWKF